jgi:hypothetical protein
MKGLIAGQKEAEESKRHKAKEGYWRLQEKQSLFRYQRKEDNQSVDWRESLGLKPCS